MNPYLLAAVALTWSFLFAILGRKPSDRFFGALGLLLTIGGLLL